jgi:hypothetical protein
MSGGKVTVTVLLTILGCETLRLHEVPLFFYTNATFFPEQNAECTYESNYLKQITTSQNLSYFPKTAFSTTKL